ncbi:peroxidase family protein [Methylobacterium durans]|uniref:Heme peroxidase n=1 Tax=Methylobacterium durans TaxID=2202825 RepID=A0A2U8WB88_9HYPH|nr:peroxidase family protein [Methylobacterium durans]AWN42710.1 hypothetical protein DK389_22140 [Methylobacterium durans]
MGVKMGVKFNRSDLDFILTQIQMAEAGQDPLNPHLSFGLRQVDGENNSVVDGQPLYGAADQAFPKLTNPVFQAADGAPAGFFGPGSPAIPGSSYASTNGFVFDADPRTISNLIADQSANNPAAVAAAEKAAGSLGTGYQHSLPGADGIVGTADDVVSNAATPAATENGSLFINNVTPDNGLSAPFNSLFTLFGQFFDHGLDLIAKGGSGTVMIPLQPDDPLYVPGGHTNFMVLTRATNQPGADGVLGTTDDVHSNTNLVTPFVDQNQTYTSHPSHQVFLREYIIGSDGKIHSTGRLLEHHRSDGTIGGEPTWADIKANALKLGIVLNDTIDVVNIPLVKVDAYGNFIPDPATGLAQLVTGLGPDGKYGTDDDVVVHGTRDANGTIHPITTDGALRIGHAFINDVAASANPVDPQTGLFLTPDSDGLINDAEHPLAAGSFDVDLLNAHFIAGDGRANENIGLTSIHEIFHDEHNRLIEQTKDLIRAELANGDTAFASNWVLDGANLSDGIQDNEWNGERLFQAAKFGTETQYQHLVFEEFARKVSPAIHLFGNTNVHLDPAITSEFANAVYRFGHSMLDENLNRYELNPDGSTKLDANGHPIMTQIGLIQAFTNPLEYAKHGADAAGELIAGAANQVGNEIDEFVTGALRNNLLGLPLDLAALNIARGRETGVAPLNLVRNQIYAQTHDSSVKPYANWSEFGSYLKHEASLINFVAAYGTHHTILEATTLEGKRAAALLLVEHGQDGYSGSGVSAADIKDAHDFLHSTGAYANITDPAALKLDPNALHDASGAIPFWSTGSITGLDQVDLWIGGLAEKQNLFGGLLGSTFDYIFRIQLENLQDGDRLYYLPRLEGTHFGTEIEANSFAEMIMHNTGIKHVSASVFLTPEYTVEASNINPDDSSTWTRNPDTGKFLLEASWVKADGTPTTAADLAAQKHIHFLGDENFLGNTMVLGGTDKAEWLQAGNADDDTVYGDGGDDHIDGGNGNDFLYGGAGNDVITDTGGDDTIHGDDGNDIISAGIGDDIVFGNDGDDIIDGGKGIDDIQGGLGNDIIRAGEGDDEVLGNEGNDWIEGGQGGDVLTGDVGAPTGQLPLYGGDDVIIGGSWVAIGADGHPVPDAANLQNNNGGDKMLGFSGDDIMVGGGGFNTFRGHKGYDWASFEADTQGVEVDMNRRDFILDSPPLSPDAIRDIFIETEGLSGSSYDDHLMGSNDAKADTTNELTNINLISGLETFFAPNVPVHFNSGNIILGGGGSDRIQGGGGDDIIDGDAYLHVELQNGQIVREILDGGRKGDVDTAVYSDIAANYAIGVQTADGRGWNGADSEGFYSVVHVTVGPGVAGALTKVVNDGVDKIRNIERLEFQDTTVNLADLVFGPGLKVKNQLPVGSVTISGTPVIGQVLTADAQLLDLDPNPNSPTLVTNETFQWQYLDPARGEWVPITGATGATYTVTPFVVGQPIRVVASFVDALGFKEHVTSAQTAVVATAPGVNTAPFIVPQQGQVGLPDTNILDSAPVSLFLPVTTVFNDAQTAANALIYKVTLADGSDLFAATGLTVVDTVATNGALQITGTLKAGVTGPLNIKVSATDGGPGAPLTVTDTFTVNVVHPSPGAQAVIHGSLQDGYIAGATVFMDSNGDGVRQSFEAQTTTDAHGHFTLVGKPGQIIASGGAGAIDTATSLAFNGTFKAPAGSTVLSPLTTVLAELVDSGMSLETAQVRLRSALSLDSSVDVTKFDPIVGAQSSDPTTKALAEHLFVTASQILNTVALLQGAVFFANPMQDIVALISTGQPFDLSTPETVQSLVSSANLFGEFATDVASLIIDHNALIASQAATLDGVDFLVGASAVSRVAQGEAAQALATAYTPEEMTALKLNYTGDGLAEHVGYAKHHVGDVNGDGTAEGDGDMTPPDLSITSPPGLTKTASQTIAGKVGIIDAGMTVHIMDGGTEIGSAVSDASGNWHADVTLAGDRPHNLTAVGRDAAGNLGQSNAITVTLDSQAPPAPTVTLDHDTGSSSNDRITSDPSILVTAGESGGTLAYRIDNGEYQSKYDTTKLADGQHTVSVLHTDAAGNISLAGGLTFTLDTQAPVAPSLALKIDSGSSPSDGITGDPHVVVTQAEDGGSLSYSIDGAAYVASYDPTGLADGQHTLKVKHTDAAGNTSLAGSLTFTLDTAPPGSPTLSLTNDTGLSQSDRVTSDARVTAVTQAGATASYSLDGGAFGSSYDPVSLADGSHTLAVRQTDSAGNASAAAYITFTLDRGAPQAPAVTLADDTGLAGDGVTRDGHLSATPAEDGGSLSYVVDGKVSAIYNPATLADGQHSVALRHTDAAGNSATSAPVSFTLDTAGPSLAVTAVSGSGNVVGHTVTGTIGLADAGAAITIRDGSTVLGTVTADAAGNWSLPFAMTGGGAGHHYALTATATDAAGNIGYSESFAFDLDFAANRDLFCTVGHDMRSYEGQVYALYDAILDRAPDAAGLEGWVGALRGGASLRDIADSFLHSAEAQAKFGALDDRGFVGHLYETALHRSGETAGLDSWTGAIAHGASRADIAVAFALSGENVAGMQGALAAGIYVDDHAATDAARLYYALLDRAPDAAGLQNWTQALKGGLAETGMAQAFLGSGEYQSKHGGLNNAEYVDMLYENALGRHAEAGGLQYWADAIQHGVSREEIATAIVHSQEAHEHLAYHIEQGWHLV